LINLSNRTPASNKGYFVLSIIIIHRKNNPLFNFPIHAQAALSHSKRAKPPKFWLLISFPYPPPHTGLQHLSGVQGRNPLTVRRLIAKQVAVFVEIVADMTKTYRNRKAF